MEKTCGNCKNFQRHYVRYPRGNYSPIHHGHCMKPRVKRRIMQDNACAHWENAAPDKTGTK